LRWMRVPGDILFALGAALLGWFILGLLTGHSYQPETRASLHASSRVTEEEEVATLTSR
jgi:nitric oxide reductase subunit B